MAMDDVDERPIDLDRELGRIDPRLVGKNGQGRLIDHMNGKPTQPLQEQRRPAPRQEGSSPARDPRGAGIAARLRERQEEAPAPRRRGGRGLEALLRRVQAMREDLQRIEEDLLEEMEQL
jgi:hypothetical protein